MNTMDLQKGQKMKLSDSASEGTIQIQVSASLRGGKAQITCFGVDAAGKLSDDRYFIFEKQASAPGGTVSMTNQSQATVFSLDLERLPSSIRKLVIAVAADGAVMRDLSTSSISLATQDGTCANYAFSGAGFQDERALILAEVYQKDGIWRYSIVASGFNGGLDALLTYYGGDVSKLRARLNSGPEPARQEPAAPTHPDTTPPEAPKIKLSKISLTKSGQSHKIDLKKNDGEIHVNLNWNRGKKKWFLSGGDIDLDLACMYRLKNGKKGVIQALGNAFGSSVSEPFIRLDQDDRSGSSANGENMFFQKPDLLDFAIVFAFIYEGVPNWSSTDAVVVLKQSGSPDIEIRIDNPNTKERFCVLASLSGKDGSLEVKREDKFFTSHQQVDQYYQFGFRWVAGRK